MSDQTYAIDIDNSTPQAAPLNVINQPENIFEFLPDRVSGKLRELCELVGVAANTIMGEIENDGRKTRFRKSSPEEWERSPIFVGGEPMTYDKERLEVIVTVIDIPQIACNIVTRRVAHTERLFNHR